MEKRIILHLDMDCFFAQVEEKFNPHFRGKPVVVGSDPKEGKGRGVVSTCNYEARKYGIKSGLPISRAWQLYPGAVFLPVDGKLYEEASARIMKIVEGYSPAMEVAGLDEAYLDISYAGNYEKAKKLAGKLKNEIFRKEKLTATVGVGPNKLIAKMAAQSQKPDGLLVIRPRDVRNFLSPLDVDDLPGVGPITAKNLYALGIRKIGDLAAKTGSELKKLFGKNGMTIYWRSRGVDSEPVGIKFPVKSIGREVTFGEDTRNGKIILEVLDGLTREICQALKEGQFSFKTITAICRFKDFETHSRSKTLERKSRDFAVFRQKVKKLLLYLLIGEIKPLRLVGARVSGLEKLDSSATSPNL